MAFKPTSFPYPDVLKQFKPEILIRLLETSRLFFDMKGFAIPAPEAGDLDYESLARILADPDEEMPGELVDGLHLISELGNEACFDDLLQMAGEADIPVDEEVTPQDLAALIWLTKPRLLQQKPQESSFERRKTFESFAPADTAMVIDRRITATAVPRNTGRPARKGMEAVADHASQPEILCSGSASASGAVRAKAGGPSY